MMFADIGVRVVAADLDPQAHLTAASLPIDDLVAPIISGDPPAAPSVYEVTNRFGLVPGDLELSFVEDALSAAWADNLNDSALVKGRGLLGSAALAKAVRDAGSIFRADIALIDIGPNLGAITRAALLGADYVIVPVAPDIFSLKGLTNVGRGLRAWRQGWAKRLADLEPPITGWPTGHMVPLGYVVSRVGSFKGDQARLGRWINRMPEIFHREILGESTPVPVTVHEDPACMAWLKDYHSLMAMAREARKPLFQLKPSDGAIGGHQQAVLAAYSEFRRLAEVVAARAGVDLP